ncbi:MAG: sterol desaturase family protein [Bacteriovoracaceae bacterium]|nr:sterol desaturase family protein [Bacteriovoracaceae bacterium]
MLIAMILGLLFWSPLEYCIHRFLGHDWTFRNKFRTEHQKHHYLKDYFAGPLDKLMAAFPVMVVFFVVGLLVVSWQVSLTFSFAFLVSYLFYEKVHKDLHVKEPKTRFGKALRKHHFYHHFTDPSVNHGVTTVFWDIVFGTYVVPDQVDVPKNYQMIWLTEDNPDYQIVESRPA